MTDRVPDVDLYALLGVSAEADSAELARAYRRRLREVHPDTRERPTPHGGPGSVSHGRAGAKDDASAELRALQEAYLVLRDPRRRARYDAQRRIGHRPTPRRGIVIPVRRHVPAAHSRKEWIRVGPVRIAPLPPRARS